MQFKKRCIFVSIILLFLISIAANATPVKVNYLFIIDTSGSMVGLPKGSGNRVIFPEVKETLKRYISEIPLGSTVFVFPFDEGIHDQFQITINDDKDVSQLAAFIEGLKAEGKNTEIYRSMLSALNRYWAYRNSHSDGPDTPAIIYLFTDGLDTTNFPMSQIIEEFKMNANFNDHLYYFSLGPQITDAIKEFTESESRFRVVRVEEEMPVPELTDVIAKVPVLKYGNIKDAGSAKRLEKFELNSSGERTEPLRIDMVPNFPEVEREGGLLEISPDYIVFPPGKDEVEVLIELEIAKENPIPDGKYDGHICFETEDHLISIVPKCIEASFSWEPPRIINVEVAGDDLEKQLKFGKLDPYVQQRVVIQRNITLHYTDNARAYPDSFDIAIVESPDNPLKIDQGGFIKLSGPGFRPVVKNQIIRGSPCCNKGIQEHIALELVLRKDVIKSGQYSGTLEFHEGCFEIHGKSIEPDPNNPGVKSVSWSMEVARPPLPLYLKILTYLAAAVILALILALLAFFITAKLYGRTLSENYNCWKYALFPSTLPMLEGSLRIIEPDEFRNMTIELEGKRSIVIGHDGDFLEDIEDARVRIFTRHEEDHVGCILKVVKGRVEVENSDTHEKGLVSEVELGNDDIIDIGAYRIKFQSYDYVH